MRRNVLLKLEETDDLIIDRGRAKIRQLLNVHVTDISDVETMQLLLALGRTVVEFVENKDVLQISREDLRKMLRDALVVMRKVEGEGNNV